jgi:nicotinamidase-related amidase
MDSAMDPKTTALILVGYQNDYFAQDGILRGVVEEPNRVDRVRADTVAFIARAADTEMTIISTPVVLEPNCRALAEPIGTLNSIKESRAFKVGSARAETIPELLAYGDRVMDITGKVGFNACSNTALDGVLVEPGTREERVAGMVTSLCIDSTSRAAYERGYDVTILCDCASARTPGEQDLDCRNIFPLYGGVARSSEITRDDVAVAA